MIILREIVNSRQVPPSRGLGTLPRLPQQCSYEDDPHSTKEETVNNNEVKSRHWKPTKRFKTKI